MKLSTPLMYSGNPREAADQVAELEKAGLDTVWVAEAYGFDSPTLMGYLAAKTETVEIGSAILNIYSRTPGALLQTAAGLDNVSNGRAIIGLGASGPQVIEGFHGVPYDRSVGRTREIIDLIRRGLRRETLTSDGIYKLPLPEGQGLGLGKPLKLLTKPERRSIPLYIAALGPKSVEGAATYADGWLPFLFLPERADQVWGDSLRSGLAKRQEGLAPLEISAGGMVAIGEDVKGLLDLARPHLRVVRRRHGRPRQELLQRPRLPVRLGEGGQEDPGPLPRWQQARRRGRSPARMAGAGQPGRPGVVRQGAARRLPRKRASPTCRSRRPPRTRLPRFGSSRNGCRERLMAPAL